MIILFGIRLINFGSKEKLKLSKDEIEKLSKFIENTKKYNL